MPDVGFIPLFKKYPFTSDVSIIRNPIKEEISNEEFSKKLEILENKLDKILTKLDTIFGDTVLINKQWVDIKEVLKNG